MRHKAIIDLFIKYDICINLEVRSKTIKKYECQFNGLSFQWFTIRGQSEVIGARIRKIVDKDNLENNYLAGFFVSKIKEIEFYIINNK